MLLPETIVNLTTRDRSEGIHSSDLNFCPFNAVRQKMFDYYYPIDQIWQITRGNAWDTFCSTYREKGAIYHTEYTKLLDGVPILGNPDKISVARRGIRDFKAPGYVGKDYLEKGPKEYYIRQLNTYVWMTYEELKEKYGIEIDNVALHICGPNTYLYMPAPVWPVQQTEDILRRRLEQLMNIMDSPEAGVRCNDDDCFGCWPRRSQTVWIE
jgi:hypothetical protein